VNEGTRLDVEKLARDNDNLREQRQAVSDVLRAVASSEGLQAVLVEIVEAAKRLCRGEHAQLYLAEGDLFRIFSQSFDLHEAYDYAQEHPHARDRTTIVGRVGLTGVTEQIPDVLADADYSYEGQRMIGYRALLGVPIVLDGELIGVIAVARNNVGTFAEEQVELVRTFADQAAIAIANGRLIAAVDRQRTELARYIAPAVAELISSEQGEQLLAGHRGYITCLFCDLRGFTAFAETAAPEELFEVLRAYHETLGELIAAYEGTLEHFAGDGVMVFFNDPIEIDEHELQAIRFALAAQEKFAALAQSWKKRGIQLGLGIGVESGYATLGRIGFEGRYDYGALGPVTSLASRLSSSAEAGQILIGPRVFGAVEDSVDAVHFDELELKGFGRPITTFEIRGVRESGAAT
jgi:class 3 adenylate cyclase